MLVRRALPFLKQADRMRTALQRGAERLLALQRSDDSWYGSWRRYVGSSHGATNTLGVAGIGLAEAYRITRDPSCLEGARRAASFASAHLGSGATHQAHHPRFTATDLILLHRLYELTGDAAYRARAAEEWRNIRSYFYFATADELHRFFQKIERPTGAWDLAFYLEAAELAGDSGWADGAAAVLSRTLEGNYFDPSNEYRALNVAGAVRALAGQGYGAVHRAELEALQSALMGFVDGNNLGASVQDSAYAALALYAAGGQARLVANELVEWLVACQEPWGGWMVDGVQYPHVDGEALWAIAVCLSRRGRGDRTAGKPVGATTSRPAMARWRAFGSHDPVAPFDGE